MTLGELETLLMAWGRWYGERPGHDDEGERPAATVHPLAVAMQHAPKTRAEAIRMKVNMDRGGIARRKRMAEAAGVRGMTIVPAHFVDPVRGSNSRSGAKPPRPVPVEIQRVNRAVLNLQAADPMRGLCLRVHYCAFGTLEERADEAARRHGEPIGVRTYRSAVRDAKLLLLGMMLEAAA